MFVVIHIVPKHGFCVRVCTGMFQSSILPGDSPFYPLLPYEYTRTLFTTMSHYSGGCQENHSPNQRDTSRNETYNTESQGKQRTLQSNNNKGLLNVPTNALP